MKLTPNSELTLTPSSRIVLVTGAASSGKSEWAETLATQQDKAVIYVATARENPDDAQWQAKIARHIARRPPHWQTCHVPIALAPTILHASCDRCLLVDSLGTWVANCLEDDDDTWKQAEADAIAALQQTRARVILVAEETGWGVVPAYPAGRTFRDRLGCLIRKTGQVADSVYLTLGGYAIDLAVLGTPLPPVTDS